MLPSRRISKTNANHFNALSSPNPYIDTSRFASNLERLVIGYDCTRISDLKKVTGLMLTHPGLYFLRGNETDWDAVKLWQT